MNRHAPLLVAGPGDAHMFSAPALTAPQPAQSQPGPASWIPYPSSSHTVTRGRYITSKDPRGYIPVWEYHLNGQWLMMDSENGYVLWTGIWKALGHPKADIVKMVESLPELSPHLRRVRGGYLKIQGTWLPYEYAVNLARRVAWPIRDDLIPFFGPSFPPTCLTPSDPGYGRVVPPATNRRRRRTLPTEEAPLVSASSTSNAFLPQPPHGQRLDFGAGDDRGPSLRVSTAATSTNTRYAPYPAAPASAQKFSHDPPAADMFSGQPSVHHRRWSSSGTSSPESATSASTRSSPLSPPSHSLFHSSSSDRPILPPLSSLSLLPGRSLPPISSMTMLSHEYGTANDFPDPASVLRRLRLDDQASRRRLHSSE